MPPTEHPPWLRLERRDFLAAAIITSLASGGFLCLFYLWEWAGHSPPLPLVWTLVAISILLSLATRKRHYLLVLGICSIGYWIKIRPVEGIYFFSSCVLLYLLLHRCGRVGIALFWIMLFVLGFAGFPCLYHWFPEPTGQVSWLPGLAAAGFLVRYCYYGRQWSRAVPARPAPGFFEHLSYLAFIPQMLTGLHFSPWSQWRKSGQTPGTLLSGFRILLLAAAKITCFKVFLIPVLYPSGSFMGVWAFILLGYLKWFLWLSSHLDMGVAFCRFLGAPIPSAFQWPLLACSPVEHWRRWNVFNRRFLLRFVYTPLGGNSTRAYRNIGAVMAASLFMTGGSLLFSPTTADPYFLALSWIVFISLQYALIGIFLIFCKKPGLEHSPCRTKTGHIMGLIATQLAVAWCHTAILGSSLFPGDPLLTAGEKLSLALHAFGLGLD